MIAVIAVIVGLLAGPAQAAQNPNGRFLGVVPRQAAPAPASVAKPLASPGIVRGGGNLAYNGGPVMHSDANYAIFWEPSGYATPESYKDAIATYFAGVAADSGLATNVYAVDTEYYDTAGAVKSYAPYSASFGGSLQDTQAYPASGCPVRSGIPCLTDTQIAAEVNRVVTANHYPRGLGAVYYLFFPPGVASCFDTAGRTCSSNYFCAYHSSSATAAGTVLYADMPYAAVSGCDPGQRPNGDPADATLNVLSHENNETITDPLGNAWYDSRGQENGDKCGFVFGTPLGGASGSYYNQLIAGHSYWLQEEWSNVVSGCVQREAAPPPPADELPTAGFTHTPAAPVAGTPAGFEGSASGDPDGSITAYNWTFGDGGGATGPSPTHTYAQAGTYTVTLQVTDSSGQSASASQAITVSRPAPPADESPTASFSYVKYSAGLVKFTGSGADPDGSITRISWNFGDGTTSDRASILHRFPAAGTYTVKLTVVDSSGLSATVTQTATA